MNNEPWKYLIKQFIINKLGKCKYSPFLGEFTVFAGLSDCLDFMENFKFSSSDISYLQTVMPHCEQQFFHYLQQLKPDQIIIEAIQVK